MNNDARALKLGADQARKLGPIDHIHVYFRSEDPFQVNSCQKIFGRGGSFFTNLKEVYNFIVTPATVSAHGASA